MSSFLDKKQDIRDYIFQEWDSTIVPTLCEYIKIPCQSPDYDPEWNSNGLIDQAMSLLVQWVKAQPLQRVKCIDLHKEEGKTPFLLIELEGHTDNDNTVLIYGHMDKQPPMVDPPWEEGLGPYIPVIRDGKLYGRGGADDGYAVFAAVSSIIALQKSGLPHGRIVIVIEGCEESGSFDLDFYMEKCKVQIGNVGMVVCLDSGAYTYDRMWLTGSLRGIIGGTLKIETLHEPIHSGLGGGVCPCPFRIARQLLDRIEDASTGDILVKELQVPNVPEHALCGFQKLQEVGPDVFFNTFNFPTHLSPEVLSKDQTELLIRNNWKASLTITGLCGYPDCRSAGNVIQKCIECKISIRLPPKVDCNVATTIVKQILTENPPYNAKISFHSENGGNGWCAEALPDWLQQAVNEGSEMFFGHSSGYCAIGGSIPFMKMLGDWYPKASFVITGVLGPKSNAHGPNEFLHIEFGKKLTCAISKILVEHHLHNL